LPTATNALTSDEEGALDSPPTPPGVSHEFSLPAVDSGRDAWLFLAACFVMEALIWGEF
jgi:hypothetical protein